MANEYQDINLNARHKGKLNMTGELSIPELPDLITAPLGENAIGMKNGVTYHWNRILSEWQPIGTPGAEVEYSSAITSVEITSQFMDATFPDNKVVLFSNITDYPDQVAAVQKYTTGWFLNLYGNKLA